MSSVFEGVTEPEVLDLNLIWKTSISLNQNRYVDSPVLLTDLLASMVQDFSVGIQSDSRVYNVTPKDPINYCYGLRAIRWMNDNCGYFTLEMAEALKGKLLCALPDAIRWSVDGGIYVPGYYLGDIPSAIRWTRILDVPVPHNLVILSSIGRRKGDDIVVPHKFVANTSNPQPTAPPLTFR